MGAFVAVWDILFTCAVGTHAYDKHLVAARLPLYVRMLRVRTVENLITT